MNRALAKVTRFWFCALCTEAVAFAAGSLRGQLVDSSTFAHFTLISDKHDPVLPQSSSGSFTDQIGEYIETIKRMVAENWYLNEINPHTPVNATVYVLFNIDRDGSHGPAVITTSSGSRSLDSSCLRAVQRVKNFGELPVDYTGAFLRVQYFCSYPGRSPAAQRKKSK